MNEIGEHCNKNLANIKVAKLIYKKQIHGQYRDKNISKLYKVLLPPLIGEIRDRIPQV
jgi:hypothetical protein